MVRVLKNAFTLGLGAVDLAREEANKAADHLGKTYRKETVEGRKELNALLRKTKSRAERLQSTIKREAKASLKNQRFVSENDINKLGSALVQLGSTTRRILDRAIKEVAKEASGRAGAKPSAKRRAARK